jgi:hypothetical protein
MKWFRMYGDLIHDPKVLKLSDNLRWIWIGILCIASKNDGNLPSTDDIALVLRLKPKKVGEAMSKLITAGLVDDLPGGPRPHNWAKWQYKSDDSTARVRRHRERQRNVSETPPETETETETESERESRQTAVADSRASIGRKTPWPPGFAITADHFTYAGAKGIDRIKATEGFNKFRNHHQAKGNTFADWNAAWRTWIDREGQFNNARDNDQDRNKIDDRL